MKATRVPGAGVTGTGSRATIVAWATEKTFTTMKNSISPIPISMATSSTASQSWVSSRSTQCVGHTR